MQGSGVEVFLCQPGLVSSALYAKADYGKLTTNLINVTQKIYGQSPARGCLGELRAATDPTIEGKRGYKLQS